MLASANRLTVDPKQFASYLQRSIDIGMKQYHISFSRSAQDHIIEVMQKAATSKNLLIGDQLDTILTRDGTEDAHVSQKVGDSILFQHGFFADRAPKQRDIYRNKAISFYQEASFGFKEIDDRKSASVCKELSARFDYVSNILEDIRVHAEVLFAYASIEPAYRSDLKLLPMDPYVMELMKRVRLDDNRIASRVLKELKIETPYRSLSSTLQ